MTTETIHVPEIHCDHCRESIEGALTPIAGVAHTEVDVEARVVTVSYDPHAVDRDALVGAIEEQGYPHRPCRGRRRRHRPRPGRGAAG
ncbi:MAG: cation transporter [Actinobacteria bacterium]|nr:cation transporter [Actinomycetota bacterium]